MELSTFLLHFIYIAGTFIGGVAAGYLGYEKINAFLKKLFNKN